jgi:hypothetical protein
MEHFSYIHKYFKAVTGPLLIFKFFNFYLYLFNDAKHNYNNQFKEEDMGRGCSMHGKERNAYRTLVGKPEGKRTLLGLGGRIVLKCMLEREYGVVWTVFISG